MASLFGWYLKKDLQGVRGGSTSQEPLGDKVIGRENAKGKGSELGMCLAGLKEQQRGQRCWRTLREKKKVGS